MAEKAPPGRSALPDKLAQDLDRLAAAWLRRARLTGDREALELGRLLAAALVTHVRGDFKSRKDANEWARNIVREATNVRKEEWELLPISIREAFLIGWDFKGERLHTSEAFDRLGIALHVALQSRPPLDKLASDIAWDVLLVFPYLTNRHDLPDRIARRVRAQRVRLDAPDVDSERELLKIACEEAGMSSRAVTTGMKYLAMRDKKPLGEPPRRPSRRQ